MQITVETIKSLSLFSKLTESDIAASLHIFQLIEPEEPNYRIFEEGGVGDSLFLVLKGCVEIEKTIDAEKGTSKILATLPAGSFFGEMALLTGEARSASAVLRGVGGQLIKVERNSFMKFMASTPHIASLLLGALVSSLSERLRATSTDVVTLFETGRIIGKNSDFNEMVSQVLDRMIKVTSATAGFVMLWNEIVDCFECKVALPDFPPVTILQNDSLLSRYWLNLDMPVTKETSENFVEPFDLGFNLPSILYTPLIVKAEDPNQGYKKIDKVTGVAVLVSSKPNAFTFQHMNLSKSVADQVSQAVVNSRLMMENEARREHGLVYVTANL